MSERIIHGLTEQGLRLAEQLEHGSETGTLPPALAQALSSISRKLREWSDARSAPAKGL